MIIEKLNEKISYIHGPMFVFHVLHGTEAIGLAELGISQLVPQVLHDMKQGLGLDVPDVLIAVHGHFDHAGSAYRWKQEFPSATLAGSQHAADALADPEAIGGYLRSMQSASANPFFKEVFPQSEDTPVIGPVEFDTILKEGDKMDLGDLELAVYETPGHSDCSLSLFHEKSGTVFASDACGLPLSSGRIWPTAFVNSQEYVTSLEKIIALEPETLCLGHLPPVKGRIKVDRYLRKNIESAHSYFEKVHALLAEHGNDKGRVVQALNDDYGRDSIPMIAWVISYGNNTMVKQVMKNG